ncbi:unnamed protein product, partial [Scytosiphon promiscuus]
MQIAALRMSLEERTAEVAASSRQMEALEVSLGGKTQEVARSLQKVTSLETILEAETARADAFAAEVALLREQLSEEGRSSAEVLQAVRRELAEARDAALRNDARSLQDDGEVKGSSETTSRASERLHDRESSAAVGLFQLIVGQNETVSSISDGNITFSRAASPVAEQFTEPVNGGRHATSMGEHRSPFPGQCQEDQADCPLGEGAAMAEVMAMAGNLGGSGGSGDDG